MLQVGAAPTCEEVVEALGEYLEDALSDEDRACVEQHCVLCDGCDEYLRQLRLVKAAGRTLAPDAPRLDGDALDGLLDAFRRR